MSANASDLTIYQNEQGKTTHVRFGDGEAVPVASCQPATVLGGLAWVVMVKPNAHKFVAGPPPAPLEAKVDVPPPPPDTMEGLNRTT